MYLTRRLSADIESPLKGRISIVPRKDPALAERTSNQTWKVSTAVVVDENLRLISSNPKADANAMLTPTRKTRATLINSGARRDRSPLRSAYVAKEDAVIYLMVRNFLSACGRAFWPNALPNSFITKTVGLQAQFDILRILANDAYETKKISVAAFYDKLKSAEGSGRSLIRRTIEERIGLNTGLGESMASGDTVD